MSRSIVCLKIPAFPIAVERALSKTLIARPIVLARSASPRASLLSVSTEAAAFGVRRGMMLSQARRSCRDLSVIYPNPPLYKRAMSAIQKITGEYSPLVEPNRFGQNYIDMTGMERLFGKTASVAELLRQRLLRELRLPSEAGLSVNKLVSRVAAFDASPSGLLEVLYGSEEPFMEPHRVNVLPAADRDTRTKLIEFNIQLVQQLKEIKIDLLLQALGPVAFQLSRQARGVDPEPVTPPSIPPRIMLAEELKEDSNEREVIECLVRRMTVEGSFQLNSRQQSACELVMSVYYSDGQTSQNSLRLRKCTDNTSVWLQIADKLLIRTVTRRVRVRRVELVFTRLSATAHQIDLWQSVGKDRNDFVMSVKSEDALRTVAELQIRFGAKTVMYGLAA
jgi:DNA polymerase-4